MPSGSKVAFRTSARRVGDIGDRTGVAPPAADGTRGRRRTSGPCRTIHRPAATRARPGVDADDADAEAARHHSRNETTSARSGTASGRP